MEFKDNLKTLSKIIIINDEYDSKDVFVHSFSDLLSADAVFAVLRKG